MKLLSDERITLTLHRHLLAYYYTDWEMQEYWKCLPDSRTDHGAAVGFALPLPIKNRNWAGCVQDAIRKTSGDIVTCEPWTSPDVVAKWDALGNWASWTRTGKHWKRPSFDLQVLGTGDSFEGSS